jgi:prophage regulatory protein
MVIIAMVKAMQPVLVDMKKVCAMTSLSRAMVNRYRAEQRFPRPVSLGEKRIAFVAAEIDQWIQERINARQSKPGSDPEAAKALAGRAA